MHQPPAYIPANQSSAIPGTAELFHKLTGAQWIDEMHLAEEVKPLTVNPPLAEKELMEFLLPLYESYKKIAPQLAIKCSTHPGSFTLHTMEPIPKGTIVTEYLGAWCPDSKERSSYRWGPIDAKQYRNAGAMVEDGFPNLAAFYLYDIDQLPLRILFIALEDISAGDMLTIHYGMSHSVKINAHTEYRLEQMLAFFREHSIHHAINLVRDLTSRKKKDLGWEQCLALENVTAKLHYLFQTPSAMVQFLLKNRESADEIFELYDDLSTRYCLLGFPLKPNPRQEEIQYLLSEIRTYFMKPRNSDAQLESLIGQVRVRLAINFFLKLIQLYDEPDLLQKECILLDRCFDAICANDRAGFNAALSQSELKESLREEAHRFAQAHNRDAMMWN